MPKSRAGDLARIEELRSEGLMQSGREPCLGQIAEALVLEEGKLARLLLAAQRTLSLDAPAGEPDSPVPFGACLEDRSLPKPEEVLVGVSLKQQLDAALAGLSPRGARILQERFGLAGDARQSLLAVGRKHGLSKERVRQIEKKTLRKIRASESVRQLKVYAN